MTATAEETAREIADKYLPYASHGFANHNLRGAITAVLLAYGAAERERVIEDCAKVADEHYGVEIGRAKEWAGTINRQVYDHRATAAWDIAAAIRALASAATGREASK